MSHLGNSPRQHLVLRLEARKSFALSVWITDRAGRALDITGSTIRLVVKKSPFDGTDVADADNLITNAAAIIEDPTTGYAALYLQASDLDFKPGEYPFALVLLNDGYSSVLGRGVVDLVDNPEAASVGSTYVGGETASALRIALEGANALKIETGATLAPGIVSFTVSDKLKLDGIEPGAQANVRADWNAPEGDPSQILNKPSAGDLLPPGGSPGAVLVKMSALDGDADWAQIAAGGGGAGLDATGVPAGWVPVANGVDSWDWEELVGGVESVNGQTGAVVLDADDIADGLTKVQMTQVERDKLAGIDGSDWADITNKPAFGTASLLDDTQVLRPGQVDGDDITSGEIDKAYLPKVSQLRGFSSGTAAPSGGADGDLYFQYT